MRSKIDSNEMGRVENSEDDDNRLECSGRNAEVEDMGVEEASCEGVGNEEYLMRRTLTAHIDYIYTQDHPKHKHH
ncbi:hypothetical protein CDL12_06202 [Handroanthus impetiginosus]|uniref:Phytosulfokine n=1 Tax=Handroanthus impetiginosus TaxID=429701 RepID=A0A2G9HUB3_9LAMI|nr:hypothetical protein CDL12_06202 [Handroanthus impetiginosus]